MIASGDNRFTASEKDVGLSCKEDDRSRPRRRNQRMAKDATGSGGGTF